MNQKMSLSKMKMTTKTRDVPLIVGCSDLSLSDESSRTGRVNDVPPEGDHHTYVDYRYLCIVFDS